MFDITFMMINLEHCFYSRDDNSSIIETDNYI